MIAGHEMTGHGVSPRTHVVPPQTAQQLSPTAQVVGPHTSPAPASEPASIPNALSLGAPPSSSRPWLEPQAETSSVERRIEKRNEVVMEVMGQSVPRGCAILGDRAFIVPRRLGEFPHAREPAMMLLHGGLDMRNASLLMPVSASILTLFFAASFLGCGGDDEPGTDGGGGGTDSGVRTDGGTPVSSSGVWRPAFRTFRASRQG
jgi:hypothetical protein